MIQESGHAADKRAMVDFTVPLAGLAGAEKNLHRTAANVARMGFDGPADSVDLSAEMVALMEARLHFAASIRVAQTEDQITQSLVDLIG